LKAQLVLKEEQKRKLADAKARTKQRAEELKAKSKQQEEERLALDIAAKAKSQDGKRGGGGAARKRRDMRRRKRPKKNEKHTRKKERNEKEAAGAATRRTGRHSHAAPHPTNQTLKEHTETPLASLAVGGRSHKCNLRHH
jgi:hypothetical protein